MKKLLFLLLPIMLTPSLSACQDTAHSIIPIHTTFDETKFVEINTIIFEDLVESGQQFAVEFYSPYCTHCEELNPKLEKYVKETNNLIYRFDLSKLDKEGLDALIKKYPDVLPDQYVPAIRFVSDSHLTYEVDSVKFESYKKLRQILNQHFLSSHINLVSSTAGYNGFVGNYSSYLVCRYDLYNKFSVKFVTEALMTKEMEKKNIPILLLNSTDFDNSEYLALTDEYNQKAGSLNFVAIVKNGEKTKVADYLADDFNFTSFIN